jgi:outer membrane protein assembly factor BamB
MEASMKPKLPLFYRHRKCNGFVNKIAILIISTVLLPFNNTIAAVDIPVLWQANVDMVMEGSAMVIDLDGDGAAEILTAAYENIIVVDGTGKELWRFDTRGRYSTCPAILERENQIPLIYAGDNQGMFTCLDGSGKIVWQIESAPVFCSSPALADLDGDGQSEVIQGDKNGGVSVYDALSGKIKWQQKIDGECSSPAVGDLDGDGFPEIIIATTAGKVIALSAKGETLWEFYVGSSSLDWSTCSPVLFQNSAGDACIAAGSQAGQFFCLDSKGNVLWKRSTRGAIASTISVGDPDLDGRADLFTVTQLGILYRYDEGGLVLWEIDTQGRSLAPGALFDVDGDGTSEYVLSTQSGNLLIFNMDGDVIYNHQFGSRTINVTPAIGDIVKERAGLEMAITGGEGGLIYCLGIPAPAQAQIQWSTYRGDNHLTAAWFGLAASDKIQMVPENLSWDQIYTGTEILFRIKNPGTEKRMLKAAAGCLRPDGSRQSAVGQIIGQNGLLKLPVTVSAPGIFHFDWNVKDPEGKILVTGSRQLTLQPYVNDRALAKRTVLALEKKIEILKSDKSMDGLETVLNRELKGIAEESAALASLQAAAPGATPEFCEQLNDRTTKLTIRSQRALSLAQIADSLIKSVVKNQLLAFEGLMWENRQVDQQLPSEIAIPLKIKRRSISGEHEPVSIKLLNMNPESVSISCTLQKKSGSPQITVFEVKPVPTNQKTIAWDPLEPLGNKKITIPSLETREIWLDIDLAGVKAGEYELLTIFDSGKAKTTVEIRLEIVPFKMAGFDAMRLCCWAGYNENAVVDLLQHGNTVFTCPLPPVKITGEEPFQLNIDFTALDEFIRPMKGHDVYLLMPGIPDLAVPLEDAVYVPRLAQYLDQVLKQLAAAGIPEDHVALYPHDEPGGHGWETIRHYITFAGQGVKARPALKFYVNGGGDLAMFEALNEIAAIWCPSYFMLGDKTPVMNFLKQSGKILWTYDCAYAYARPIGANVKTINVVAQYRLPAVFAHHFGATGIGYWCYNVGPSMWEPIELEYPLVYTNKDGTHTSSRRWEAVREGIEDTRIIIALQEKLKDPGVSEEAKSQIRHLVDVTLPAIAGQSLQEVKMGVARYVIDASNNDDTVNVLRKEILDCVALLAE